MTRRIGWVIAAMGAAVASVGVPAGVAAHSATDPLYAWNRGQVCSVGAGCPGELAFSFDPGARQIHDLSGLSAASGSCSGSTPTGSATASYSGIFYQLHGDIPVAADGSFAFHGTFDANVNEPGKTPGTLDIQGTLRSDGTATGTYHVAATYLTSFGVGCPVDGVTTTFTATGPPVPGPQNHAPVANADRVPAKAWRTPVRVLANDTDADGDTLMVVRVEKMKCGRLQIGPDRTTVTFVPPLKGCPSKQRGVYVASDGKAESNRASFFTPVVGPHTDPTRGTQSNASQCYRTDVVLAPRRVQAPPKAPYDVVGRLTDTGGLHVIVKGDIDFPVDGKPGFYVRRYKVIGTTRSDLKTRPPGVESFSTIASIQAKGRAISVSPSTQGPRLSVDTQRKSATSEQPTSGLHAVSRWTPESPLLAGSISLLHVGAPTLSVSVSARIGIANGVGGAILGEAKTSASLDTVRRDLDPSPGAGRVRAWTKIPCKSGFDGS